MAVLDGRLVLADHERQAAEVRLLAAAHTHMLVFYHKERGHEPGRDRAQVVVLPVVGHAHSEDRGQISFLNALEIASKSQYRVLARLVAGLLRCLYDAAWGQAGHTVRDVVELGMLDLVTAVVLLLW